MDINQNMSFLVPQHPWPQRLHTKMVIWGFSLSIPHSLGRALDLLKHFKTPARSLSAGEARKVSFGFVFATLPKPARSFLDVVQRKPSAKWIPGIFHFHQHLLNPAWQDSLPPPHSLFPFSCTVCLISDNHKLYLQSPLPAPPLTSASKWHGKPLSHLWQAQEFWRNLILRD